MAAPGSVPSTKRADISSLLLEADDKRWTGLGDPSTKGRGSVQDLADGKQRAAKGKLVELGEKRSRVVVDGMGLESFILSASREAEGI